MTRRDFLQTTLTAAALAPMTSLVAQDVSKKPALKKAVNLAMVKADKASVLDRFKMVKDAGFDGVELNRPDAIPLDEILKARDATGLEIAGVTCSTHWGKPLTHQDPAVREQGLRGLKLALQEAGELKCTRLLLVPGVVSKEVSYAEAYKRSQEAIREAIPAAEKAGCKIGIENVWNQFLLSPMEAARFVDELDSPWVGWHFDIGNVVTFGWPEQWIRILGPRILNVHIKEYSRKKRDQAGPYKGFDVELGEGDVEWPEVVKALGEIGYKGYGILEVPGGDAARLKFLAERTNKILST
ncbi:MAG: sugar phosphate isomerase/epimerase [Verrucomicrobiaceae bacterium]|nr:MAG: sugar phosphate isomerase/epimerase [Verrucomicrobiaceae bacterium]